MREHQSYYKARRRTVHEVTNTGKENLGDVLSWRDKAESLGISKRLEFTGKTRNWRGENYIERALWKSSENLPQVSVQHLLSHTFEETTQGLRNKYLT